VAGDWRRLHSKDLRNLYNSHDTDEIDGHAARLGATSLTFRRKNWRERSIWKTYAQMEG